MGRNTRRCSTRKTTCTPEIPPKEGDVFENLACAAVWIVRPDLLKEVPSDKPSDFGRDIFPEALAQGLPLAGFKTADLVADLGTPERLAAFAKRRQGLQT